MTDEAIVSMGLNVAAAGFQSVLLLVILLALLGVVFSLTRHLLGVSGRG